MAISIDRKSVLWMSSTSLEADMHAMRTMGVLSDAVGFDEVFDAVSSSNMRRVAAWMLGMHGYCGPSSPEELERELYSDGGAFSVHAVRYDHVYRLTDVGGETLYSRIDGGGGRQLREEARQGIKSIMDSLGTSADGDTVLRNFYRAAIVKAAEQCEDAFYGISAIATVPTEPAAGGPSDGADDGVRTVVHERVIVKETEPVLETMLREAMVKAMVDMNIDDITAQIKERLVSEFGFQPVRHVVKAAEFERDVNEVVHHEFDTVMHWVANNVPIYMYGAAGSGKNVLAEQVAKALGMDFYFMNSVTDEFKISGFIDAYGAYHETEFYKAFKNGGLFFLDELDASAPEVLVCLNAAIANGYFSFPVGRVDAHKDFRVIAAGNTLGTGADASYTGRMQLDAASLNRFVVVEVDYDPAIDMLCAGGDSELVEFFSRFRKAVKECGLPVVASYRNITQMRIACAKLKLPKAFQQCLCKEMNQDDINIVAERMSDMKGNRYYDGFRKVKSIIG